MSEPEPSSAVRNSVGTNEDLTDWLVAGEGGFVEVGVQRKMRQGAKGVGDQGRAGVIVNVSTLERLVEGSGMGTGT